jgi:ubiquinone/menaquinone biosynthesis C-methylase UbiE
MTHSDLAALRGEPSYVWRSGQERRLKMIEHWAKLDDARVLEHGGGLGMYASQIRRRYRAQVDLFDIEQERVHEALSEIPNALVAAAEQLPYASDTFDTLFSNEVIEHVNDDRASMSEIVRVLKVGGRAVIFCPNRWYPFETHGHYWKGEYHFGNTPLINYLPDAWRNQLVPHVRAYTKSSLSALWQNLPAKVVHHSRIYGGYDNIIARLGALGKVLHGLYALEGTPFDTWGLSHLVVLEKTHRD